MRFPRIASMINVACVGLACCLSASVIITMEATRAQAEAEAKLASAQASSRQAWQKYYDLEEQWIEKSDAAFTAHSLEAWRLQSQIDTCTAALAKAAKK